MNIWVKQFARKLHKRNRIRKIEGSSFCVRKKEQKKEIQSKVEFVKTCLEV